MDLLNEIKLIAILSNTEINQSNKEQIKSLAIKSLIKRNIKKGEIFSWKNLTTKRPGTGDFASYKIYNLFGKKAKKDIKKNYLIKKNYIK